MYRENILDHYKHPRNFGELPGATHCHSADNPACGDKLSMYLKIDEAGKIEAASFTGTGCAISMAAASLCIEHIIGKPKDGLSSINKDTIQSLLGISINPGREQCAYLVLSALLFPSPS